MAASFPRPSRSGEKEDRRAAGSGSRAPRRRASGEGAVRARGEAADLTNAAPSGISPGASLATADRERAMLASERRTRGIAGQDGEQKHGGRRKQKRGELVGCKDTGLVCANCSNLGAERGPGVAARGSERPHTIEAALSFLITRARLLGVANREDQRDLAQETMVRALSAIGGIGRDVCIKAWLPAIMRNLHIDRARRRRREPVHLSLDEAGAELDEVASPSSASRRLDVSQVLAALAALPDEFRGPFELYTFHGLNYREIADEYGLSLATVGTRLYRARAKLEELLNRT
jgi:RNA polymerase sigma-70 factor (ECF subfamily)